MSIRLIDTSYTLELIEAIEGCPDPDFIAAFRKLDSEGWSFYPVKQNRGRCKMSDRSITIPEFAYKRSKEYLYWYVAHEMAHAIDRCQHSHGPEFMRILQKICPVDCMHYETTYKPKNAKAAGISAFPR